MLPNDSPLCQEFILGECHFPDALYCSAECKLGSNLGPNADKHRLKLSTVTQRKAVRTNEIYFCSLPWAQGVGGPNPLV